MNINGRKTFENKIILYCSNENRPRLQWKSITNLHCVCNDSNIPTCCMGIKNIISNRFYNGERDLFSFWENKSENCR